MNFFPNEEEAEEEGSLPFAEGARMMQARSDLVRAVLMFIVTNDDLDQCQDIYGPDYHATLSVAAGEAENALVWGAREYARAVDDMSAIEGWEWLKEAGR